MAQTMATTMDNPYNPFTHFDEWLAFDNLHNYNTCGLIAYFNEASRFMEDEDYEYETDQAIDRLLEFNPFGIHMKVYESDGDKYIKLANEAFRSSQTTNNS